MEIARDSGIRICGPNAEGFQNEVDGTGAVLKTLKLLEEGDQVDIVVGVVTLANEVRSPVGNLDGLREITTKQRKPFIFFSFTMASDFGWRALCSAGSITFTNMRNLTAAKRNAPSARIDGVLIEQMAPQGVEMTIGAVHDETFGMILTVGAGGVTTELFKDLSRRSAPVADREALAMLHELRTFPLLDGFRGTPKADIEALMRLIVQISQFAVANVVHTRSGTEPGTRTSSWQRLHHRRRDDCCRSSDTLRLW